MRSAAAFAVGVWTSIPSVSRKHIVAACEASLRRLRTDYIDVYMSHEPDLFVPVEETVRAFDDLVRHGKVRYVGCSNHSAWHVMKALSAADRLGVSAQTLVKWRVTGEGPAFVKVSHKCVRYEQAALDAWVASRRRRSTSEAGAATAADPKAA